MTQFNQLQDLCGNLREREALPSLLDRNLGGHRAVGASFHLALEFSNTEVSRVVSRHK